jgi:hypothetical protein
MSEWCAENAVGVFGTITLKRAIDAHEAKLKKQKTSNHHH